MRISSIISFPVSTVDPFVELPVARELMQASAFHHLVVTRGGKVLGVVSDRDISRNRPRLWDDVWRVQDIMTPSPITTTPDATVSNTVKLMQDLQIHCLPVMRGDVLVGIITASDLLGLLVNDSPRRARKMLHTGP